MPCTRFQPPGEITTVPRVAVVRQEVKAASVAGKAPGGELKDLTGRQLAKSQETQGRQAAWASGCEVAAQGSGLWWIRRNDFPPTLCGASGLTGIHSRGRACLWEQKSKPSICRRSKCPSVVIPAGSPPAPELPNAEAPGSLNLPTAQAPRRPAAPDSGSGSLYSGEGRRVHLPALQRKARLPSAKCIPAALAARARREGRFL